MKNRIKVAITFFVVLILFTCGFANIHLVEFYIVPISLGGLYETNLPLFVIIFSSGFFGFLAGCLIEFQRSGKYRRRYKTDQIIIEDLSKKLAIYHKKANVDEDDISGLLD